MVLRNSNRFIWTTCTTLVVFLIATFFVFIPENSNFVLGENGGFVSSPRVSVGDDYTVVLRNDGTVWAWGLNSNGQLGDGSNIDRTSPVKVYGLTNVTKVVTGAKHTLALKSDGTVWAWGANESGELGDDTTTDRNVPVEVYDVKNVVDLAAGQQHSVALLSNGTVWTWGSDAHGQLGDDNDIKNKKTPVKVHGSSNTNSLTDIVSIAAGDAHTLALSSSGTVHSWGSNSNGQLGEYDDYNNKVNYIDYPYEDTVYGISHVASIAARGNHSAAIKNDGTVWGWGANDKAQIGDGTTSQRPIPTEAYNMKDKNIVQIKCGAKYTSALSSSGDVWIWGANDYGQLGIGQQYFSGQICYYPSQVGLTGIIDIANGHYHTEAIKNDGSVWGWGNDSYEKLGDETTTDSGLPVQALKINAYSGGSNISTTTHVSAGQHHSVLVDKNGKVWVWGENATGELGNNSLAESHIPTRNSLYGITMLDSGYDYVSAVRSDGSVWGWGENDQGQIGDGTTINRYFPIESFQLGATGIKSISSGWYHTVALKTDGTVWTWGNNQSGELGDGTTTSRSTPEQVPGLTDIIDVCAGRAHTVALKNDGTVWAWGEGYYGQLGNGETGMAWISPQQVHNLIGVKAIEGGASHTVALKDDGTVWAWGLNSNGQLGDGTTIDKSTPVQVSGLTGITAISAGANHTVAIKDDGTIWSWGINSFGQLGDGSTTSRTLPVQVSGLKNVTDISAGVFHVLAIKNDGTIWAWGENDHGQLGDGTTTNRYVPVEVQMLGAASLPEPTEHDSTQIPTTTPTTSTTNQSVSSVNTTNVDNSDQVTDQNSISSSDANSNSSSIPTENIAALDTTNSDTLASNQQSTNQQTTQNNTGQKVILLLEVFLWIVIFYIGTRFLSKIIVNKNIIL